MENAHIVLYRGGNALLIKEGDVARNTTASRDDGRVQQREGFNEEDENNDEYEEDHQRMRPPRRRRIIITLEARLTVLARDDSVVLGGYESSVFVRKEERVDVDVAFAAFYPASAAANVGGSARPRGREFKLERK